MAHIARTWFAAKQLNRYTIVSQICSPNCGSWRAVEKVGYIRTGVELRVRIADGKYVDKYIYTWLNPYVLPILFPDGVPQEYIPSVEKAKETLEKGDEYIKYI